MDCEKFKEKILDLLYDELAPSETTELGRHLNSCPQCTAELNELKRLRNELAEWKEPEVRDFPVSVPYPTLWSALRQWFFPSHWTWRQGLAVTTAVALAFLITLSVLGTRLEISAHGLTFQADLFRRQPIPVSNITTPAGVSTESPILQQVSLMIQESEHRQQELLKSEESRLVDQLSSGYRTQLADLAQSIETKHKVDLVSVYDNLEQQRLADLQRIRSTFSSLDERTSQQAQQTQQLVDFIRNASYSPK